MKERTQIVSDPQKISFLDIPKELWPYNFIDPGYSDFRSNIKLLLNLSLTCSNFNAFFKQPLLAFHLLRDYGNKGKMAEIIRANPEVSLQKIPLKCLDSELVMSISVLQFTLHDETDENFDFMLKEMGEKYITQIKDQAAEHLLYCLDLLKRGILHLPPDMSIEMAEANVKKAIISRHLYIDKQFTKLSSFSSDPPSINTNRITTLCELI